MTNTGERIPFSIEISRMIEVLASQIYPSPFALLRENTQNSFDAILLRKHKGFNFEPSVSITLTSTEIKVADNGIGMSRQDLKTHFWRAGASSKNNPEARAAGVVGTFGIGAMANFGIAEELNVVSESAVTGERTLCIARRSTLSVTDDCIEFIAHTPTGQPGTIVTATMQTNKAVNVEKAKSYIRDFVAYVPISVTVNGELISKKAIAESVPRLSTSWTLVEQVQLSQNLKATIDLEVSSSGEVRVALNGIELRGEQVAGEIILKQNVGGLRTFRSSFGLATVSVNSAYQFGGIADFLFLQPTAGREALTTESMQVLQEIVAQTDDYVSRKLGTRPESNANTNFMNWVVQRGLYELCGNLILKVEPGGQNCTLQELKRRSEHQPLLVYAGVDPEFIRHASEDRPLVLLSRSNPRRQCESEYLRRFCKIDELTDEPRVLDSKSEISMAESALAFRVASILSSDYFLDARIFFGSISHGLPALVTGRNKPAEVYLDPRSASVRQLIALYDREYEAFGNMAKDFVRNIVFPRVSDLVPSSTRQGAEAFLKSIQRNKEVFEYESSDLDSLGSIWKDYVDGKLTMAEAAHRSSIVAVQTFQEIEPSTAGTVREVVPGILENEEALKGPADEKASHAPMPSIERRDLPTEKKLLTIPEQDPPLRDYRCFLALTDRVREERGSFFLQPHRTSVVWGGQKVLFVFEHHSGEFGLYYDIQASDVVGEESGGGSFVTCTIVMKNRIFIPIPEPIRNYFLPKDSEKKRLEVRCDILYRSK